MAALEQQALHGAGARRELLGEAHRGAVEVRRQRRLAILKNTLESGTKKKKKKGLQLMWGHFKAAFCS